MNKIRYTNDFVKKQKQKSISTNKNQVNNILHQILQFRKDDTATTSQNIDYDDDMVVGAQYTN